MDFIAILHSQINPVALLIASGQAFFLGILMVILVLLGRRWMTGSPGRVIGTLLVIIGVALVFTSSTPFPAWIYYLWSIFLFVAFLFPSCVRRKTLPIFLALSLLLCILELPYHIAKKIPVRPDQKVYVIGDSISAGLGKSEKTWPTVLGQNANMNITNLAVPGATVSSALPQIDRITMTDSLVILEIGGNDMLGGTPADQFANGLGTLLRRIPKTCRCVMFELPLIPFHSEYGHAQRSLAKKYHITLIPKASLTNVLGINGDTVDGIHLSQKGHNALAESVLRILEIKR